MSLDSTVVVCAHNEEKYIHDCLASILDQTLPASLIIVVLDRCGDRTREITETVLARARFLIIEKNVGSWKNSISENLELARGKAVGVGFVVVDADMVAPREFLEKLIPQLKDYSVISPLARTDPSEGMLNRFVSLWERTYRFAPLGEQPRGGARAISRSDLDLLGGFRDVIAWETDLDIRLRTSGRRVKLDTTLSVLHRRKMTLRRSVSYQIQAGEARRELGVPFGRTLLHAVFRLRPFVVYGYLKGATESPKEK